MRGLLWLATSVFSYITVSYFALHILYIDHSWDKRNNVFFVHPLIVSCLYFFVNEITWLIVSITKFSIVIGSPRAYLALNWRAITWVSNNRYPVWTFCNCIPVIRYPRDSHVNYAHFNGFFRNVSHSFQNLRTALQTFSLKRSSQKTF